MSKSNRPFLSRKEARVLLSIFTEAAETGTTENLSCAVRSAVQADNSTRSDFVIAIANLAKVPCRTVRNYAYNPHPLLDGVFQGAITQLAEDLRATGVSTSHGSKPSSPPRQYAPPAAAPALQD